MRLVLIIRALVYALDKFVRELRIDLNSAVISLSSN